MFYKKENLAMALKNVGSPLHFSLIFQFFTFFKSLLNKLSLFPSVILKLIFKNSICFEAIDKNFWKVLGALCIKQITITKDVNSLSL